MPHLENEFEFLGNTGRTLSARKQGHSMPPRMPVHLHLLPVLSTPLEDLSGELLGLLFLTSQLY